MLKIDVSVGQNLEKRVRSFSRRARHRGHIVVINLPALESHSCECYAVVKKEFDRLLPWIKAQSGV